MKKETRGRKKDPSKQVRVPMWCLDVVKDLIKALRNKEASTEDLKAFLESLEID